MKTGEVYSLKIDLHATSNYFPAGHLIRLEVSSHNFPRFDRNMNAAGNNFEESEGVVAENTVCHSRDRIVHFVVRSSLMALTARGRQQRISCTTFP